MPEPLTLDRRTFCACALATAGLACGGGGGGSAEANIPSGPKTTTDTKAALLAQASGTIHDYRNLGHFWLIRDGAGIYALTSTCTHQGCTVGQGGPAFACPCHGSQFDLNGTNVAGPAPSPLVHFAVTEPTPGADLVVDTSQTVPAATRLT
ncbi:MAG TPA: Rieske (2Fe-2S) protein [Holophagaceae bacterium]|nr:Rieske (2Fe-2S) protein [Holophagaceae bacterium]